MDMKVAVLLFCVVFMLMSMLAVEETSAAPAPKKNEPDYHYHKETHKNKHKNRHKHKHGHRKKKYRRSGLASPGASADPVSPTLTDTAVSSRRQSLNTRIRNMLLGGASSSSAEGPDASQQQFETYSPFPASRQSNQNGNRETTSFGPVSSLAGDFNTPDMQFPREETGGEFAEDTQGVETGAGGFERSSGKDEFASGFGNDYQSNFEEYTGPYTASGDNYRYEGYKKK